MHNDESHPQQPSQAAGEEVTDEELSHLYFNHDNPDAEHVSISFGRAVLELAAARPPAPPEGARVPAAVVSDVAGAGPRDVCIEWRGGIVSPGTKLYLAASPEAAEARGWLPIETAPKDGTLILLGRQKGVWAGKYVPVYPSGYVPDNPWSSHLLNHDHMAERSGRPTHWMPLPSPPPADEETGK